ncbi:hypothetical protein BH23GEM4_BH23GEM4_02930 [soil metagenome]|jgi:hypothetical protein
MAQKANLKVGEPDVKPSTPSHTPGTRKGNEPGSYEKQEGHLPNGKSTAARSTGIKPEASNPIDPRMPNLSPA